MKFPIDLGAFTPLQFTPSQGELTDDQAAKLQANIQLVRDSIIFFTAYANTKGLGGHTGGAYDIVPELLIIDGFMKGGDAVHPVYFDEAGHRVAIQYLMAVLNGHKPIESLLHYREFGSGLYGLNRDAKRTESKVVRWRDLDQGDVEGHTPASEKGRYL